MRPGCRPRNRPRAVKTLERRARLLHKTPKKIPQRRQGMCCLWPGDSPRHPHRHLFPRVRRHSPKGGPASRGCQAPEQDEIKAKRNAKREHRLTSVLSLSVCDFLVCPPAAAVDCLRRQVQSVAHLRVRFAPHVALNDARRLICRQLKRQDIRHGPLRGHRG